MGDLVEFLLARVEEDEGVARRTDADGGAWFDDLAWLDSALDPGGLDPETPRRAISEHVARHSPDRVLAECEAKRRIIDLYTETMEWPLHLAVGALAQPYRDHPDWREEWAL